MKIFVEKLNESYLQITADDGTLKEISEIFSFRVDGYRFMPKYKSGQWDGYIRLFNSHTGLLYAGLYRKLYEFAKKTGYELEFIPNEVYDRPFFRTQISDEDIDSFISSLKIQSDGEDLDSRDYQREAIRAALVNHRITLVSPTASGKSYIIYGIIRYVLEHDPDINILLIVPTTSLVEQMLSDFKDYSTANEFDVDAHCHTLYSGKEKMTSKPILITTWQSIQNERPAFFSRFGMVIGDEAHGAKADKMRGIMEKCCNAYYRIGTTGTLPKDVGQSLTIVGLFGSVYDVISTKELMDLGYIAGIEIDCLLLNWDKETTKIIAKAKPDYKTEVELIVTNKNRNQRIIDLASKLKGNTLILFNLVEKQGKPLYEIAKNLEHKKVYLIYGGVKVEERERIRLEAGEINNGLYIASFGTMSTGTNIKSFENLIIASPVKSSIRLLQSIGRGLRLNKGKKMCRLFDIGDNLRYSDKSKNNITLNHYISRIEIYDEQKFNYRIIEKDFYA